MKKLKTFILFLSLAALVLSVPSCDKTPIDGTKLIINYDIVKTKMNFKFLDAATGEQIAQTNKGSDVSVTITGTDKNAVIDVTGIELENHHAQTVNGFLTLGLNPNSEYVPSSDNPISFIVVAKADGYISTSMPIKIYQEGNYQFKIMMVKLDDPPEGVTVEEESNAGDLNNGEVAQDITVETGGSEASITFNQGMTMTGDNGSPLNGSIDVMVTHFDNLNDQALEAFPGGLTPDVNQNGTLESGIFFSAGFVAVEVVDASGNKAAQFSGGTATLEMTVNPETYNPETKGPVKPGDEIPLYSYDPETGTWTYEQTVTVKEGEKGLTVTAEISHLSYWNLDWFYSENCDYGVTLNILTDGSLCSDVFIEGTIRKVADDSYISTIYPYLEGGEDHITFQYAPAGIPVYIEWNTEDNYSCGTNTELVVIPAVLDIPDLCSTESYDVMISNPSPGPSVVIDVSAYCADNPDLVIYPTFGGWYRPVENYCWNYITMIDGHAEICDVEVGRTYVVGTYFYGNWYEETVTVTQSYYNYMNIELTPEICDELSGW